MLYITEQEKAALKVLGNSLKASRKHRGDKQIDAANRCGVSRETYRNMEQGKSRTGIETWVRAIRLYGDLSQAEALFPSSLFEEFSGKHE